MATVFWFSHQPSDESSGTSGNTIRAILNCIPGINQMEEVEKERLVEELQPLARKLAHFSVYTLGGILIMLYINETSLIEEKKIICSSLIGSFYAISDEIHQIFIPGRACMIIDIVIDSIGILLGVVFVYSIIEVINRRKLHE